MLFRKNRRKIERKLRGEISKPKKKKNWLFKHLDLPITNRFTRTQSYLILIVDTVFMFICAYWAYYEIFVRSY